MNNITMLELEVIHLMIKTNNQEQLVFMCRYMRPIHNQYITIASLGSKTKQYQHTTDIQINKTKTQVRKGTIVPV